MRHQTLQRPERQEAHRGDGEHQHGRAELIARPAVPPEPPRQQGHHGVAGRREQGPGDPGGTHGRAPAAAHKDGQARERAQDGRQPTAAEPFAHGQARAERDEYGARAQRDHGGDGEPGRLDPREVRGLEDAQGDPGDDDPHRLAPTRFRRGPDPARSQGARHEQQAEAAQTAPERQGCGAASLARKTSEAASPAVPQAAPATTRWKSPRPTGNSGAAPAGGIRDEVPAESAATVCDTWFSTKKAAAPHGRGRGGDADCRLRAAVTRSGRPEPDLRQTGRRSAMLRTATARVKRPGAEARVRVNA